MARAPLPLRLLLASLQISRSFRSVVKEIVSLALGVGAYMITYGWFFDANAWTDRGILVLVATITTSLALFCVLVAIYGVARIALWFHARSNRPRIIT